jgi:hypothetical protein
MGKKRKESRRQNLLPTLALKPNSSKQSDCSSDFVKKTQTYFPTETHLHLRKFELNIQIAHERLAELTILPKELLTRSAKKIKMRTENFYATKLPIASNFTTLNNYCFKLYLVVKSLNFGGCFWEPTTHLMIGRASCKC